MRTHSWLRVVALITIAFFLPTVTVYAAPSSYKIKVSDEFGQVTQRYKGSGEKVIIHVQDAHSCLEAQKNLAKIICELIPQIQENEVTDASNAAQTPFIGIEGAFQEYDLKELRQFPLPEVRERVGLKYVKEGKFIGAELASIISDDDFTLFGLEDKEPFVQNFQAFYSVSLRQSELENEIEKIEGYLDMLKEATYNTSLKEFDEKASLYERNQTNLIEYLGVLYNAIDASNIDLMDYIPLFQFKEVLLLQQSIDFEQVSKEIDSIATRLSGDEFPKISKEVIEQYQKYKEGTVDQKNITQYLIAQAIKQNIRPVEYQNLSRAAQYWHKYAMTDVNQLLQDILKVNNEIRMRVAKNDDERIVIKTWARIVTLKQLLSLKALKNDVDEFRNNKRAYDIENILTDIKRIVMRKQLNLTIDTPKVNINELLDKVDQYYQAADKRDAAMLDNLKEHMDKTGQQIGVLVAGGYHSTGIVDMLKNEDISYVTITPQITNMVEDVAYMDRMMGNVAPLNPAFTSPFTFSRLQAASIAILNNGDEVFKNVFVDSARNDEEVGAMLNEGRMPSDIAFYDSVIEKLSAIAADSTNARHAQAAYYQGIYSQLQKQGTLRQLTEAINQTNSEQNQTAIKDNLSEVERQAIKHLDTVIDEETGFRTQFMQDIGYAFATIGRQRGILNELTDGAKESLLGRMGKRKPVTANDVLSLGNLRYEKAAKIRNSIRTAQREVPHLTRAIGILTKQRDQYLGPINQANLLNDCETLFSLYQSRDSMKDKGLTGTSELAEVEHAILSIESKLQKRSLFQNAVQAFSIIRQIRDLQTEMNQQQAILDNKASLEKKANELEKEANNLWHRGERMREQENTRAAQEMNDVLGIVIEELEKDIAQEVDVATSNLGISQGLAAEDILTIADGFSFWTRATSTSSAYSSMNEVQGADTALGGIKRTYERLVNGLDSLEAKHPGLLPVIITALENVPEPVFTKRRFNLMRDGWENTWNDILQYIESEIRGEMQQADPRVTKEAVAYFRNTISPLLSEVMRPLNSDSIARALSSQQAFNKQVAFMLSNLDSAGFAKRFNGKDAVLRTAERNIKALQNQIQQVNAMYGQLSSVAALEAVLRQMGRMDIFDRIFRQGQESSVLEKRNVYAADTATLISPMALNVPVGTRSLANMTNEAVRVDIDNLNLLLSDAMWRYGYGFLQRDITNIEIVDGPNMIIPEDGVLRLNRTLVSNIDTMNMNWTNSIAGVVGSVSDNTMNLLEYVLFHEMFHASSMTTDILTRFYNLENVYDSLQNKGDLTLNEFIDIFEEAFLKWGDEAIMFAMRTTDEAEFPESQIMRLGIDSAMLWAVENSEINRKLNNEELRKELRDTIATALGDFGIRDLVYEAVTDSSEYSQAKPLLDALAETCVDHTGLYDVPANADTTRKLAIDYDSLSDGEVAVYESVADSIGVEYINLADADTLTGEYVVITRNADYKPGNQCKGFVVMPVLDNTLAQLSVAHFKLVLYSLLAMNQPKALDLATIFVNWENFTPSAEFSTAVNNMVNYATNVKQAKIAA